MWSKQRGVIESVRDNRRTAIKSGHGVGKTLTAAVTTLWFVSCFPDSRVITTAPTEAQIKGQLWHEIGALWRSSSFPLTPDKPLKMRLDFEDGRYAMGAVADPYSAVSFQGHHAENILTIFDEASGMDERIFEASEGYMTSAGAKQLLIGNPTEPAGSFYDAFSRKRDTYSTHTISVLDSPAFTGEKVPEHVLARLPSRQFVEDAKKMWGEDSPLYQVRVLGQFPSTADDTVISLADTERAQAKRINPGAPTVVSCDVARFGRDETTIAVRRGNSVRIVDHYIGKDTVHTTGRIIQVAAEHPGCKIVVDDDGVGGGVTDQVNGSLLSAHGAGWGIKNVRAKVVPFHGGGRPLDKDGYPNARSEMWFSFSERLRDGEIDLDPDPQLAADLTSPKYKLDSRGRRVVEPKADTKKRLGRSPDRADAVLMAYWEGQPGPPQVLGRDQNPWR